MDLSTLQDAKLIDADINFYKSKIEILKTLLNTKRIKIQPTDSGKTNNIIYLVDKTKDDTVNFLINETEKKLKEAYLKLEKL